MSQTIQFIQLPPEIKLGIINYLEVPLTVRCRALCRHFRNLIDQDVGTRYRIQLYLNGKRDGEPGPVGSGAFERMTTLWKYQTSWTKSEWTWSETLTLDGNMFAWESVGSVFGYVLRSPLSFNFIQLPSVTRNVEFKKWSFPAPEHTKDFTMDPSQDLLVTMFFTNNSKDINVAFNSLSDGSPHSDAAENQFILNVSKPYRPDACEVHIQIHYELVGILLSPIHGEYRFDLFVGNWRTGNFIFHLDWFRARRVHGVHSFCILSSRYLLLTSQELDVSGKVLAPTILAYDIDDVEKEPVAFCFPTIRHDYGHVSRMTVFGECPSVPCHRTISPFTTCHRNRLIVTDLFVEVDDMSGSTPVSVQEWAVFCTPASIFLNVLNGTKFRRVDPQTKGPLENVIDWRDWGVRGSRLLLLPDTSRTWVCTVHGMKYICIPPSAPDTDFLIVDFNVTDNTESDSENLLSSMSKHTDDDESIFNEFTAHLLPATAIMGKPAIPKTKIGEFSSMYWMLVEDGVIRVLASQVKIL